MNRRIWIIGGTSEGRGLVKELAQLDIEIFVSVATTYGAKLIEQHSNVKVLPERMDLAAMQAFIAEHKPDCVIDATHPYATVVTQTVKDACAATGTEYLRLVRPAEAGYGSAVVVHDAAEAAEVLSHTEGKIFLTTGSKNLSDFTAVPDYAERIALRILPMQDSLAKAVELGYKPANIVCMQGPFEEDLNIAMIKHFGAKYLVTKDSGKAGGFEEKIAAAHEAGAELVIIARSENEHGSGYAEIAAEIKRRYQTAE